MGRPTSIDDLEVVTRGEVPDDIADYARGRISRLRDHVNEPIVHTRVRLTHEPNPAVERPVRAQGNVSLKGRMVRAQVAGRDAREAVDLLMDRLCERLARDTRHRESRRGSRPAPGAELTEWRHAMPEAQRPPYYPRPFAEREVIRHKSLRPQRVTPDEAAWEMDQFDHDFHLFTDAETGRDAIVFRDGPTGYRFARVTEGPEPTGGDPPVTLDPRPAPRLALDEARERLEAGDLPFVFFVDRDTYRGAVLYHRYDGHYGLISVS